MVIVSEKPSVLPGSIEALNFDMVKLKLQDPEEGKGWDIETCEEAEHEYRYFLALKVAYPEEEIVPNQLVDAFWHQHILDTWAYHQDCQAVFGGYLHHYPYFGMNGPEDAQNLADAFERTKLLYARHFGEAFGGRHGKCGSHHCRTQCKPMKCK